jgi:hypothetical protein
LEEPDDPNQAAESGRACVVLSPSANRSWRGWSEGGGGGGGGAAFTVSVAEALAIEPPAFVTTTT